jgi:hypothetical protein
VTRHVREVGGLGRAITLLALLGACSGTDVPAGSTPASDLEVVETTAVVADPAPDATVEDTIRDAAEEGEVLPAGGATLTVGGREWSFPAVVCLFGDDAAQVGAEFALSAVANGYELYAAKYDERDVVTLDDIDGIAPEPVSLTSRGNGRSIRVDGRRVTARITLVAPDEPGARGAEGALDAECS